MCQVDRSWREYTSYKCANRRRTFPSPTSCRVPEDGLALEVNKKKKETNLFWTNIWWNERHAPGGLLLQRYPVSCTKNLCPRRLWHEILPGERHSRKYVKKWRRYSWVGSYKFSWQNYQTLSDNHFLITSVKAKSKGEYISWPNDRRHLAPSPTGSILK